MLWGSYLCVCVCVWAAETSGNCCPSDNPVCIALRHKPLPGMPVKLLGTVIVWVSARIHVSSALQPAHLSNTAVVGHMPQHAVQ